MDLQGLKLFRALGENMQWLGQRQRVLSQNVANADTPDYVANDLKPIDFRHALRQSSSSAGGAVPMARTEGTHLAGTKAGGQFRGGDDRTVYETTPTGNSVTLEEQMLKVSDTSEAYKLTTQIYKKYNSMLRLAVRGSGG
jgi:flagellar basal-body rod protein FlgB